MGLLKATKERNLQIPFILMDFHSLRSVKLKYFHEANTFWMNLDGTYILQNLFSSAQTAAAKHVLHFKSPSLNFDSALKVNFILFPDC